MLTATGPTAAWRHQPIGAGRVEAGMFTSPNKWEEFNRMRRRSIVWEGDGVESSVALDRGLPEGELLSATVRQQVAAWERSIPHADWHVLQPLKFSATKQP